MDRTLVLAAGFSAALHAGLLLGPNRGPVPTSKPPSAVTKDFVITRQPDPPEPPDVFDSGEKKDASKQHLVPTGLDESTPNPTGFPVDIPRVPPLQVTGVKELGPMVIGLPDGKEGLAARVGITLGDLDNSPRTRTQIPPAYPFEAKSRGQTGRVTVEFVVDESGRVLDPHVVNSTDRIFEEPTLRAIARWRFEPGRKDGRIVRFRMAVPVEFNLNND